jgi:CheY-like chemotaxis protein
MHAIFRHDPEWLVCLRLIGHGTRDTMIDVFHGGLGVVILSFAIVGAGASVAQRDGKGLLVSGLAIALPAAAAGLAKAVRYMIGTRDQVRESNAQATRAQEDLRVYRARADVEVNAANIAKDRAIREARRAEEAAEEAHKKSLLGPKIEANAAEIANLRSEVTTLKIEREAFKEENRTLYADLYREALADFVRIGFAAAAPIDVSEYIPALPLVVPVDSVAATLLIVEDHEDTGRQLARFLRANGWAVKVATTYGHAIEALEGEKPPACIVLDLVLPDGQGDGLIRRIRELGLNTRVVVVSGVTEGPIVEAARLLKPDALLTKPVDFGALLRTIGLPPAISTLTLHQRMTNMEGVGVEKVDVPGQGTRLGVPRASSIPPTPHQPGPAEKGTAAP